METNQVRPELDLYEVLFNCRYDALLYGNVCYQDARYYPKSPSRFAKHYNQLLPNSDFSEFGTVDYLQSMTFAYSLYLLRVKEMAIEGLLKVPFFKESLKSFLLGFASAVIALEQSLEEIRIDDLYNEEFKNEGIPLAENRIRHSKNFIRNLLIYIPELKGEGVFVYFDDSMPIDTKEGEVAFDDNPNVLAWPIKLKLLFKAYPQIEHDVFNMSVEPRSKFLALLVDKKWTTIKRDFDRVRNAKLDSTHTEVVEYFISEVSSKKIKTE